MKIVLNRTIFIEIQNAFENIKIDILIDKKRRRFGINENFTKMLIRYMELEHFLLKSLKDTINIPVNQLHKEAGLQF